MKISTFSKRLREAMAYRRISQTELHEKTGIGKSSLSTYLKGEYQAKQDKVDLLAEALTVNPVWLMGYDVPMEINHRHTDVVRETPDGYYTDPEVAELAEELRTNPEYRILFDASKDLTKEDVNTVLKIIEGLKAREGK